MRTAELLPLQEYTNGISILYNGHPLTVVYQIFDVWCQLDHWLEKRMSSWYGANSLPNI